MRLIARSLKFKQRNELIGLMLKMKEQLPTHRNLPYLVIISR